MNSRFYIFGDFRSGRLIYPDDSTRDVFSNFIRKSSTESQLCIHRKGPLIYYGYTRTIGSSHNQTLGLCIVLNEMMIVEIERLFDLFESAIEHMLFNGYIIHFDDNGDIISTISNFHSYRQEISEISMKIKGGISHYKAIKLPAENFALNNQSSKLFSIVNDNINDIIKASYNYSYTIIGKSKDFNSDNVKGYISKIQDLKSKQTALEKENKDLTKQLSSEKRKNRNTIGIALLSAIVIIMASIIYFKVINPTEVTNLKLNGFNYYGPVKDSKPNGLGVAVYPDSDPDGRRYYVGKFVNGVRQDDHAMLLYQDGDYFYGEMSGDNWVQGIFYKNSDDTHFYGTFYNNEPSSGSWFDHKYAYSLNNGNEL